MGDAVAEAVLAQFAALPKTGKPQPHEHTVLAGIALTLPPAGSGGGSGPLTSSGFGTPQPAGGQLAVAALATGTKCLGAGRRVPGGGALNDCHAEALCRRALLRWLYAEMRHVVGACADALRSDTAAPPSLAAAASAASTRVLQLVPQGCEEGGAAAAADLCGGWRFRLQPGVQLHMYVSQPPCGDASILGAPCQAASQQLAVEAAAAGCSFGRTGAKPLKRPHPEAAAPEQGSRDPVPPPLPQQHEVESYAEAQAAGLVRRKPGRGDATLSVSCSDKLARWCLLGLQGSLLAGLLEPPLHMASLTVSLPRAAADASRPAADPGAAPAHEEEAVAAAAAALRRALLDRTAGLAAERLPPGFRQASPALHIHRRALPGAAGGGGEWAAALGLAPTSGRTSASGCSLVWCAPPSPAFKWKAGQGDVAVLRGGTSEGVVGINGLRSGSKKLPPGQPAPPAAQTALCKAALFAQWQALAAALHQLCCLGGTQLSPVAGQHAASWQLPHMTYRQAKRAACPTYGQAWARLLQPPSPLHGWVAKPPELEEFALQLPLGETCGVSNPAPDPAAASAPSAQATPGAALRSQLPN